MVKRRRAEGFPGENLVVLNPMERQRLMSVVLPNSVKEELTNEEVDVRALDLGCVQ